MSQNFQPTFNSSLGSQQINPVLAAGPYETQEIVLVDNNSASGEYTTGRLLHRDTDGKYFPLATAETTVTSATLATITDSDYQVTETVDADAGVVLIKPYDFVVTLAKPPIPGTLSVTTNDTSPLVCGTDNGEGVGSGANGSFRVDYQTGKVYVHFNSTRPANTKLIQGTYKHHAPSGALGMPECVLMEDIADADIIAGDVTTVAYFKGSFNSGKLLGYSAGYKNHLRRQGIVLVPSSAV